jgi:hypothetical protein
MISSALRQILVFGGDWEGIYDESPGAQVFTLKPNRKCIGL